MSAVSAWLGVEIFSTPRAYGTVIWISRGFPSPSAHLDLILREFPGIADSIFNTNKGMIAGEHRNFSCGQPHLALAAH